MAERFSIKSLTTRDEFKNTHVFPPMLQVNLESISCGSGPDQGFESHISPYFFAISIPHTPCFSGGSWKVLPKIGIPGIRGGSLYFRAFALSVNLHAARRTTTPSKASAKTGRRSPNLHSLGSSILNSSNSARLYL